jgi:chromosome partitioning protein
MLLVRTIAVLNQKGGVGKTTTVANLGAAVASRGRDICLIDLDPQGHLTLHLGLDPGTTPTSIYQVLAADATITSAAMPIAPHLWLIPSTIDLAGAEVELAATVGREQLLRDQLLADVLPYEFVMIDCPPSLGLLTLNALAAADEVYIPLQPHFLALQGLGKLLETVALVRRRINPRLRVTWVILCMYDSTTRLTVEVEADLRSFIERSRNTRAPWSDMRIFRTAIRRNVKLAECPSHGKSIFQYEPSSHGARDYGALADEFLAMIDTAPAPQPQGSDESQPAQAGGQAHQDTPVIAHSPDQPAAHQNAGPGEAPVESGQAIPPQAPAGDQP